MRCQPNGDLDTSLPGAPAEAVVWNALRKALGSDDGYLLHEYKVYDRRGPLRAKPDIFLIHFELGCWVLECKGCSLDNIAAIEGNEWRMREWHKQTEQPLAQVDQQLWQIRNYLQENPMTRPLQERIGWHQRVALPRIRRDAWRERFGDPPFMGSLLFADDFEDPQQLRQTLYAVQGAPRTDLEEQEWSTLLKALGLALGDSSDNQPSYNYDPQVVIRRVQERIFRLDEEQRKIATQYPEGPQRIRGLAGTGKTVVLARRAAKMHLDHPDWNIAVVFYTQSLYEIIRRHIAEACSRFDIEPNWRKIRVIHAWGSQQTPGFYRILARACGVRPKSLREAEEALRQRGDSTTQPFDPFDYVCQELERNGGQMPQLFDAVLIDEGQDLPPAFYRLAYQALREPKRLYWAYDEAQGIGSLVVPGLAELFGRDEQERPRVQLGGRAIVLRRCYRSPKSIVMAAHALNMGLLREGGPLQGVTRKEQWENLGYEVEGDFRNLGSPITLSRQGTHPVDDENFEPRVDPQTLLFWQVFPSEEQEQEWIARQIKRDIHHWHFQPEDLLVTGVFGFRSPRGYWEALKGKLKRSKIPAIIAGEDTDPAVFRQESCVTLASIFRAKGNEAWKVYVCQFHNAAPRELPVDQELLRRNQGFAALTRTKIWCVVTGVCADPNELPAAFQELKHAKEQYPQLSFPAFNQASLKRRHEVAEEDES